MVVPRPLDRSELPIDTVALARYLVGKIVVRELPEGVVRTTREKYLDAYRKLTDAMPEHLTG